MKKLLKSSKDNLIKKVEVYDLSGRQLFKKEKLNEKHLLIDLRQVANRNLLFFKVLLDNGKIWIKKTIK